MSSILAIAFFCFAAVQASPALSPRESITTLTTQEIDSFTPYTYYASAAYCSPSQALAWNCGVNCQQSPDFRPVASGGNSGSVRNWYVGYDSKLSTVVVAHQGTVRSELQPLLVDADVVMEELDAALFPGVDSSILVHKGFADQQAITAVDVLVAVRQTMSKYNTSSVTLVGHSLGGTLSLLDSVYLPLHLPSETTFRSILYGLPRVGNQEFANYLDAHVHLVHINNKEDPIPTVPSMSLGYIHPSGEVHIQDSEEWKACPGQDNPSEECIVGGVPFVWDGNFGDHDGPYNGIMMNC